MTAEADQPGKYDAPLENFARGISAVIIPEFEGIEEINFEQGKVRFSWTDGEKRLMVASDRLSAYDSVVAAVPFKGASLTLTSDYNFKWIDRHMEGLRSHTISLPHPNVLIAEEAQKTFPIEFVLRRYMARSSTSTSIFRNYQEGRREIYGIRFPEGLEANQAFPEDIGEDGFIITPTTKAAQGEHDQELTDAQAREIVDRKLGDGMWNHASKKALELYKEMYLDYRKRGLIIADTKYEFGIINGELVIIDEAGTPDSSRFWLAESYDELMANRQDPKSYDKEIARRWLAEHGFIGEGPIPIIPGEIIDTVSDAYRVPYQMITGNSLPKPEKIERVITMPNPLRVGPREITIQLAA